jgi:hypothetical protein
LIGENVRVIEVDVGYDRHVRSEAKEGVIVLIRFDDHVPSGTGRRVGTGCCQRGADRVGRISTEGDQPRDDHTARRRFAVRAGHRDTTVTVGQQAEQDRPLQHRHTGRDGGSELRVLGPDRGGDDEEAGGLGPFDIGMTNGYRNALTG